MVFNEESLLWQTWKRRLLVFCFLLSILCFTILPIWQKIGIYPTPLLIILYYWSFYRSDLLPVEQLVLISLILDGIYAYPLGFSALRLLIAYMLVMTQKRILYHQRFHWIWAGFGLLVVVDSFIYATLISFVKHEWTGIIPLMPGMLLTIGLYPPTVWAINRFVMKRFPA